jgi:thymidine kinase
MSLTVISGPMFAGKTCEMVSRIVKYIDVVGGKAIIVNSIVDTRCESEFLSSHHSNFTVPTHCVVLKAAKLADVSIEDIDVIGVDESQFFPDLYDVVTEWVRQGKHVFCAGLSGDFRQRSFEQFAALFPRADETVSLKAICVVCLRENPRPSPPQLSGFSATFSKRLTSEKERESVEAIYIPVCGKHY